MSAEMERLRDEVESARVASRQIEEWWKADRAEVERLRRALAGHLFDGESLSTREALRSELIEQGLKDSAELERLRAMLGEDA